MKPRDPARPPSKEVVLAELEQLRQKSAELSLRHPDKAAIILTAWMRQLAQVRRLTEEQARRANPKKSG